MFLGSYKIGFSGKNRLILPKKMRRELGNEDKFFVLMGPDGEIWGFNQENWLKQTQNILDKPLSSEQGRIERRKFFAKADECELDSQGRFILPQEFIDQTNLAEEILIIGAGDHLEIWSQQSWQKQQGRL